MSELKCEDCRFFDSNTPSMRGLCRREPPKTIGTSDLGFWPRVHKTDWCSEFSEKYNEVKNED